MNNSSKGALLTIAPLEIRSLISKSSPSAFGNHRVNALAFNDGYVEVVTQDRGPTYLNKADEARAAFGGGFSFVDDGESTWVTAYKWRPQGARTLRRFGMGYADCDNRQLALNIMHWLSGL